MKDLRIFVASSKELEGERNYLAYLVLSKEEEFAARGLRVRLAKWEYVDPRLTGVRTEDRSDDDWKTLLENSRSFPTSEQPVWGVV